MDRRHWKTRIFGQDWGRRNFKTATYSSTM